MKRLFMVLLFTIASTSMAFAADDAAKVKIRISGVSNKYLYLCSRDFGCFNIINAQAKGKTFSVFRSITPGSLFVMDAKSRKLYPQGMPGSCATTVATSKTVTISGQFAGSRVNGLRCSIS